jgi:hypothetical protein
LIDKATDNLVEDNIFYYLRHSMTVEFGSVGNVFGYNYSHRLFENRYPASNWLMIDAHVHGGHSCLNLYEGNIVAHIGCDNNLGSSRYNTFFRNHVERYSQGESKEIVDNVNAIMFLKYQLYENVVGNVLCRPGDTGDVWLIGWHNEDVREPIDERVEDTLLRHGNYDYVTGKTGWDPAISDHNLPDSYYLSSKPAFFGNKPWPAIGSDLNPMVGGLPAKERYLLLND